MVIIKHKVFFYSAQFDSFQNTWSVINLQHPLRRGGISCVLSVMLVSWQKNTTDSLMLAIKQRHYSHPDSVRFNAAYVTLTRILHRNKPCSPLVVHRMSTVQLFNLLRVETQRLKRRYLAWPQIDSEKRLLDCSCNSLGGVDPPSVTFKQVTEQWRQLEQRWLNCLPAKRPLGRLQLLLEPIDWCFWRLLSYPLWPFSFI